MKRSLAWLLSFVAALSGCVHVRSRSPVPVTAGMPPLDPAAESQVRIGAAWCFLHYTSTDWRLCNIHYHRPAEHVSRTTALPPCTTAGTRPDDWVEIHYAFVRGPSAHRCETLRELALDEEHNRLGTDCPAPFIVRGVWAHVTAAGTFDPARDVLPDSVRYAEYAGTSTGASGGSYAVHWKINRGCAEITEAALAGVERDPTMALQPDAVPPLQSTKGN